jgi:hypothetical protein
MCGELVCAAIEPMHLSRGEYGICTLISIGY